MQLHDNFFGNLLRNLRVEHKLTQAQLGKKVGLDNAVISKLENGHSMPSEHMLAAFSRVLGVSVAELTKRPAPPPSNPQPNKNVTAESPAAAPVEPPKGDFPLDRPADPPGDPIAAFKAAVKAANGIVPPPDFDGFDKLPGLFMRSDLVGAITGPDLRAYLVLQVGRSGNDPLFAVYREFAPPKLRRR